MIIRKPYVRGKEVNLYAIGDIHIGSVNFDEERFKRYVELVKKDKLARFIIVGDIIDEDRPTTRQRRKDMFSDRGEAYIAEDTQHLDYIDRKVLPLLSFLTPENCLGLLDGDHYRLYANGLTSTQYICSRLKVPYLGNGEAIINLTFLFHKTHTLVYSIHARHGIGFNSKQGGTVNRNIEFSKQYEGIDCYIRGHSHNCQINDYTIYRNDKQANKIEDKNIWIINTGSFRNGKKEGFTDYAELKEYGNTNKSQAMLNIKVKNIEGHRFIEAKGIYI